MVKFGSLFAALFGAGGATAYYNGATEQGTVLNYLLGSPQWLSNLNGKNLGTQNRSLEYEDLRGLVERLSRDVRNQGGAVTVIHGNNGSSAIFTYGGVILVSAMGVMWLRGWKFSDFLYVTRASLQKSMATVNASVEGLTSRMNSVRQIIGQQIDAVKTRQEEAMRKQEELKGQMEIVGMDVETTRSNVEEVHSDLTKLGGEVQALNAQQSYASEGIYLLCSVLGDIVKTSKIRTGSLPELDKYLRLSQNRGTNSGFKSLLPEENGQFHTNAQRLLPAASSPGEISTETFDGSKNFRRKSGMLPGGMWSFGANGLPYINRQASASIGGN